MIQTLNRFTTDTLFNATSAFLAKLNIEFDRETAEAIDVADLYEIPMPQYLTDALRSIDKTYFIGIVNDQSLAGAKTDESLEDITENIHHGGKYDGMFIFACDAYKDANLTRSMMAALTRAFNRISSANPVILIIRQDSRISLATCERMNYSQEWRQGGGEKLGKVNILRNIECRNDDKFHTHPGHVQILDSLREKKHSTFEELYKHWMEVFSSELLTKKFYNELSDWYAWAVMEAKFPNNIHTDEDDDKFNHESCIRLITRLIFVWFLKQKHLIPEEFFDESYIRENFIANFNPHDKQDLFYNTKESKYYRLILQNLFFAMLNCPIVAEGKSTPNNRRFRGDGQYGFKRDGYNDNSLLRYKAEFIEGGAEKFMKLANKNVPFLNGGLFDCLDNKPQGLYYDGFSDRKESIEQLNLPDYLFFGEEVGDGIDLSKWYDDKKKKKVSARGIIDILKRYCFTIEENTPYDQEVSLDPELLGKVFENLLASYNPETKQSARKQTGSFYTPREIVQYMVNESLIAHLKRMCGDEMEPEYRQLLNYASETPELDASQRKSILEAIYNCRVLDPACGSGAFPMGVLQQMVHILKQVDPTNEMWNDMMINIATENANKELKRAANASEAERAKIEENKEARLKDIEEAFNQSINDPDYARKLYLIENCIYGVDIQPIATQISKLRFFISLVVDQNPTTDAKKNFGIRPLPNLESKFVTANTLIPLDRTDDLFLSHPDVIECEKELRELNHRIFWSKKNSIKEKIKQDIYSTRSRLAQIMEYNGLIGPKGHDQVMEWDMFNQNASASFFDSEWMFGVSDGFDIVIGNPPYVNVKRGIDSSLKEQYERIYKTAVGQYDLFVIFIEFGLRIGSINCMIVPKPILNNENYVEARKLLLKNKISNIITGSNIFENAGVESCIFIANRYSNNRNINISTYQNGAFNNKKNIDVNIYSQNTSLVFSTEIDNHEVELLSKLNNFETFKRLFSIKRGVEAGKRDKSITFNSNAYPLLRGEDISMNTISYSGLYINFDHTDISKFKGLSLYSNPKILIRRVGNTIQTVFDDKGYIVLNTIYCASLKTPKASHEAFCAILNSKLIEFWFLKTYCNTDKLFPYIRVSQLENIPLPSVSLKYDELLKRYCKILHSNYDKSVKDSIDVIVYKLYNLSYEDVLTIDSNSPITRDEYDSFDVEKL